MKKIISLILVILYLFTFSANAFASLNTENTTSQAEALNLDAQAAILMDATTGEIIYSKNINDKHYPASITKLMTVLLCLENCEKDDIVTFSDNAIYSIEPGSSHIAIMPGEKLTVEQCLYGIMLQSANEVSNGIAEHVDGTIEKFCQHMTQRAKELGAQNTNFVNANGLHDENHYTSAYDMALIAKELLKFPYFKEIMASTYYEIPPTNLQSETRYLHGQNQLLKSSSIFYYEYCEGGKTGFTNEAGNTLVAYAKKGDTELISVVLQSTGYGEYTDTTALFDYGFNNYETRQLSNQGTLLGTVNIFENENDNDPFDTINAVTKENIYATIPLEYKSSNIETNLDLNDKIFGNVAKGDVIGSVEYTLDGNVIASAELISDKTVTLPEKIHLKDILPVNFKIIGIILAIIIVCFIIASYIYKKAQKAKRRKRRRQRRAQRLSENNKQFN
jgi:D-alanyl-D-alanine carboxypeptidase (penicillin-binding protein 5/6)